MPTRQFVLIDQDQYQSENRTEDESDQPRKPILRGLRQRLLKVENRSRGHFWLAPG